MLRTWGAEIFIDARFANMLFIQDEQEVLNCHRLRDAIDAGIEAEDGDLQLQCGFFDKPYTRNYFPHGGSNRTCTLEFKV